MILLIIFSFISGLLTIFAPCIWPVLPIIFITSDSDKRKSLGITAGVVVSFTVFTLLVGYLVKLLGFDPNVLRYIAATVLLIMGLMLLVPKLSALLEMFLAKFGSKNNTSQSKGFFGGFVSGLSLGALWAPCAGPILATIAALSATQSLNFESFLMVIAYSLGIGFPLFIFSLFGNKIQTKIKGTGKYTGIVQKVYGVIIILSAFLIITNQDKIIQAKLLDALPQYSSFLYTIESNNLVKKELDRITGRKEVSMGTEDFKVESFGQAPEFVGIQQWLNTNGAELKLQDYRGKVVLVDFWTYTCINCIRTFPHLKAWREKYQDQGFEILGIHSPEFEFEKNVSNVEKAIEQYGITYPVALDNDFKTWRAYENRYWPAHYLIDAKGEIRYIHEGEGNYEQTEAKIQELLKEIGAEVSNDFVEVQAYQSGRAKLTPETYLGLARMERFLSPQRAEQGDILYSYPASLNTNYFALSGTWNVQNEYAQSSTGSDLKIKFNANKVFLVIKPSAEGQTVAVSLDGNPITPEQSGKDVVNGQITLDTERLYEIVNLNSKIEEHTLDLKFVQSGIQIFAFTFEGI